jgi:hypothetical protein
MFFFKEKKDETKKRDPSKILILISYDYDLLAWKLKILL